MNMSLVDWPSGVYMILDVIFYDYSPEQIQHVRKITIFTHPAEAVITFKLPASGTQNLKMKDVRQIAVTED